MTETSVPETITEESSFKPFLKWGTVAGFVTGFVGYGLGWPMWLVLVVCSGIPVASLIAWLVTGTETVRGYRILFIIYGLAVFPVGYELWVTNKPVTEFLNIEAGPGEQDLLFEYDFPRFLGELYPDRSETLFARGYQMHMCVDYRSKGIRVPICERLENVSLEEARRYLKAAVDTGNLSEQNVLHYYAMFLWETRAPEKEVDAALAEWKRHYPFSKRRDPRRESNAATN